MRKLTRRQRKARRAKSVHVQVSANGWRTLFSGRFYEGVLWSTFRYGETPEVLSPERQAEFDRHIAWLDRREKRIHKKQIEAKQRRRRAKRGF